MIDLGVLSGTYNYAADISDDGLVVTGYAGTSGDNWHHAYRWTEAGGMADIGTLGGSYSQANAVSNDGGAVTGYSYLSGNNYHRA